MNFELLPGTEYTVLESLVACFIDRAAVGRKVT